MPYYTRAGDAGKTGICDQNRISKASQRIAAIGDVDELNSVIGLCRTICKDSQIDEILGHVQNGLFVLGSDLAAPLDSRSKAVRMDKGQTERLEKDIDDIMLDVGELQNFILPSGTELAVRLHFTRSLCRRAERAVCTLAEKEKINPADLPYINRLSSLLFVLARLANKRADVKDVEWKK
ncbi:MAG: cob(I)yrinic acid a,c-diamide adenosyltransferase [Candidatus Aenigmatarchaeota archaeon]